MKKRFLKKTVSIVCAVSLSFGAFGVLPEGTYAADPALGYWPEVLEIPSQKYYENRTLQPYGSCFQIGELKNWSPDNDPDARYNRGAIPLRKRWMGPLVNPLASRDAKVMPLAMSNARASEALSQGGNEDFVYAFNNFQYVDIFNFWGGASGEGPVAIPSPEVIDSAHRNGVPATGTIFIPWGDENFGSQFVREMLEKKDGRYIAADKLIEIAQYYGFDGYIFNSESSRGNAMPEYKDFLKYLQENKPDNFTVSWYNGNQRVNTWDIRSWMNDGERITDDWWMDMKGDGYVDSSIQAAWECDVNPWNIHSTWENWPMSSFRPNNRYQNRLDKDGKVKCSLGILAPTCTLAQSASSSDYMNVQDQKLWVGPTFDPSSTYRPANEFCGFASLVADRTPVIGTDFVTNFTTGNGYKFYENGNVTGKTTGWYNRSLTDVLPTWRWIIESEQGGKKLSAKIDYEDAWYAGTSMKFEGDMDSGKANHIKLYSTQLDIKDSSTFSITYKIPNTVTQDVTLSLGLCYGDGNAESYNDSDFKFYPIDVKATGKWETTALKLSEEQNKRAIAISLKLEAPNGVKDYAINIGSMGITTNSVKPSPVSDVTLDEVIYPDDKTMEARIYWTKGKDAFMYRIHRVHQDGTKELVGVTPLDAFYLGSFSKDSSEKACKFEITSYTENGVKGDSVLFEIAWPKEVVNGFVPVFEEGENLALYKPVASSGNDEGSVIQINNGIIPNSKWCIDSVDYGVAVIDLGENKDIRRWVVYHANCEGAKESPDFNTRDFSLSYAKDDGGAPLSNANKNTVFGLNFINADSVVGNKQDVTDRNLNQPINGRYIKLTVTKSCESQWKAIRIYEFQLYEKSAICNTASPYERNVTVHNNVGPSDTVVIDNITMLYSSGTYKNKDGQFHPDTGKVRLYESLDAVTPIAEVRAVQPDESYKQRSVGIARFQNLTLNPLGGRIFYEVLDGSGQKVEASRRASVSYPPETGEPVAKPAMNLERTTAGQQLFKQYGKLTVTGLEEGAKLRFYETKEADTPILHSNAADKNGSVVQYRVPLKPEGGTIYYEISKEGKPDSERLEYNYNNPMELTADLSGLRELVEHCDVIQQEDCVSSTWKQFYEALTNAKAKTTAVSGMAVKAREAEDARQALQKAYAKLRFKNDGQRLAELCKEFAETYKVEKYTQPSFTVFSQALTETNQMLGQNDSSALDIELQRIKLEKAVRNLQNKQEISMLPKESDVKKGQNQTFTLKVDGVQTTRNVQIEFDPDYPKPSDTATKLEGFTLTVGPNETLEKIYLKASIVSDPTSSDTAVVTVKSAELTVRITPENMDVSSDSGQKGQFHATVEGSTTTAEVIWSIEGSKSSQNGLASPGTRIENGQLFLGEDEIAPELTVVAASKEDPSKKASAKVTITNPKRAIRIDSSVTNGTILPSVTYASKDTVVTLTIKEGEGYHLREGSLKVNGKEITDNKFQMPDEEAVITAEFVKKVVVLATVNSSSLVKDYVVLSLKNQETGIIRGPFVMLEGKTQYEILVVDGNGTYDLRVQKKGHAVRTYTVEIKGESKEQTVDLNLLGDVNGDGKVDLKDWNAVYRHIAGNEPLTGYAADCADVNQDGTIDFMDWNAIYNHLVGVKPLW